MNNNPSKLAPRIGKKFKLTTQKRKKNIFEVLFLNSPPANCGVYEFGRSVAAILKKSEILNVQYQEVESEKNVFDALQKTNPCAVIVNYHPFFNRSTKLENHIPSAKEHWAPISILTACCPCIGLMHEADNKYLQKLDDATFDKLIIHDPTAKDSERVVVAPRPLPSWKIPSTNQQACISIGSFGFATPSKDFEGLVIRIQEEFDECNINFNIPFSTFGDPDGHSAFAVAERCKKIISKPKIKLTITHNYLEQKKLLEFLSSNSLNAFFYHNEDGRGVASATDFAIASGRPLALQKTNMFRHLFNLNPSPFVEKTSLKEIIANGNSGILALKKAWTTKALISSYENCVIDVMRASSIYNLRKKTLKYRQRVNSVINYSITKPFQHTEKSLISLKDDQKILKESVHSLFSALNGNKSALDRVLHELQEIQTTITRDKEALQKEQIALSSNLLKNNNSLENLKQEISQTTLHLMQRLSEHTEFLNQLQKIAYSPWTNFTPNPFALAFFLFKLRNVRLPNNAVKQTDKKRIPESGFWRSLERAIRKKRKRFFAKIGFDQDWYVQEYPEVKIFGNNPLDHYIKFGMNENKFKSSADKKRALGKNEKLNNRPSFFRRLEISIRKRRKKITACWTFDSAWYLDTNPDVKAAGIGALDHYIKFGKKEGRAKHAPNETNLTTAFKNIKKWLLIKKNKFLYLNLYEIQNQWWSLIIKPNDFDTYPKEINIVILLNRKIVASQSIKPIFPDRQFLSVLLELPNNKFELEIQVSRAKFFQKGKIKKDIYIKSSDNKFSEKIISHQFDEFINLSQISADKALVLNKEIYKNKQARNDKNSNDEDAISCAFLSPWNTKCGIAEHTADLCEHFSNIKTIIIGQQIKKDDLVKNDKDNVFRIWQIGKEKNNLENVLSLLTEKKPSFLVIQFNFGFFNHDELAVFLQNCCDLEIRVFVVIHALKCENKNRQFQLEPLLEAFKNVYLLIVHQQKDMETLNIHGIKNNVLVMEHAIRDSKIQNQNQKFNIFSLATFGFCLPNKGLEVFIKALGILKKRGFSFQALMLNALHPASGPMLENLVLEIKQNQLEHNVILFPYYLERKMIDDIIQRCHLVVNPYQNSTESASGSVRIGFTNRIPTLCTPLPIFNEIDDLILKCDGFDAENLAEGIFNSYNKLRNRTFCTSLVNKMNNWNTQHSFYNQSRNLIKLYEISK